MNRSFGSWIRRMFASVFFAGYLPGMPGTVGSAIVAGLFFYAHHRLGFRNGPQTAFLYWWAILALTALSFIVCSRAEETFGSDDPSPVIFDECVGQLVTYFMVPLGWRTIVLGFLLFRFFDIIKPYPVYAMEELDGGVGITMDDVVAGVCANITLHGVLYGYHVVKAAL